MQIRRSVVLWEGDREMYKCPYVRNLLTIMPSVSRSHFIRVNESDTAFPKMVFPYLGASFATLLRFSLCYDAKWRSTSTCWS
jgi:hypothetical protein